MSKVPDCDVLVVSEFMDISMDAKKKGLSLSVDEYTPAFKVFDGAVLIGSCMSLLELATIVYDYPRNGIQA